MSGSFGRSCTARSYARAGFVVPAGTVFEEADVAIRGRRPSEADGLTEVCQGRPLVTCQQVRGSPSRL